jgi:hypothetical protein
MRPDVIWVVEAKPLPDYRVHLRFSDQTEGDVDLREFVFSDHRPIVAELQRPEVFADMRVDMDTVVWNNGFDLAPEFLYARLTSRTSA